MPRISCVLVLILWLVSIRLAAQTLVLDGVVLDQASGSPVPFATLGILGRPFGTAADEHGTFHCVLPVAELADSTQLLLASLGYEVKRVPIAAFKAGRQTIQLRPMSVRLPEVTVRAGKVNTKVFGRTSSSTFMVARMYTEPSLFSDELAREQGTVLPIDDDCLLREAAFYVAFNRFKSVKLRLQLYSVRHGLPSQALLHENILVDVTQPRGWVKLDLRPYHIALQGMSQVAATLQWVKSEASEGSSKAFAIAAVPMPGHSILFRDKSQDQWRQVSPGRLSLYLTADSYQTGKANRSTAPVVEDPSNNVSFNRFLTKGFVYPASSHHYGDSLAAGRYVSVAGARIYCEEYGQGEPLLLLHGDGQSIKDFSQQIDALAQHFRVIAVDTRSQGKSIDSTTKPLSYALFAADMQQLLDSLHVPRARVLGWSDGGNTALEMAIRYPARLQSIAVMGANLFPAGIDPDVLLMLRKQVQLFEHEPQPTVADREQMRLHRMMLQEPRMSFEALHHVAMPVLVMAGERDLVLDVHTRALAASLPQGKLLIFAGATHNAPMEIPKLFNQQVIDFLLAY